MEIRWAVEAAVDEPGIVLQLVPVLDGRRLIDLVSEYEVARGFDVAGDYGGIIPAYFDYGSLMEYYLGGHNHRYWGKVGKIAVLGCTCGEVGCWPLYTSVVADDRTGQVVWTGFEQPHRPHRDYAGFGPFFFDRAQYEGAIRTVVGALAETAT